MIIEFPTKNPKAVAKVRYVQACLHYEIVMENYNACSPESQELFRRTLGQKNEAMDQYLKTL